MRTTRTHGRVMITWGGFRIKSPGRPAVLLGAAGAYAAAKKYAAQYWPDYHVIPGGIPGGHPNERRFTAINHGAGMGQFIYTSEN